MIGEDSYLEWYKTYKVAEKYRSERFQFFQDWGSEPENLQKNGSRGSIVAVYEYVSDKKIPSEEALEVCCEDKAFNAKPISKRALNLAAEKELELTDSLDKKDIPSDAYESFNGSKTYATQANTCKATGYKVKDEKVISPISSFMLHSSILTIFIFLIALASIRRLYHHGYYGAISQ